MKSSPSFTLIELVIVIGILAVLAAVAVIVINPAEYMKSSRDSQRLSELQTITKAIGLYLGDGNTSIGSTNTVYVSIPDSSATCANLGLPTLPAGWSYACSTSDNYRKPDATGWIPIDFTSVSFTNPLQTLPIDPINTTSTGNYYTYTTGGSFELTAYMESSKYKMGGNNDKASKDGGAYPELYETGSNLTLLPVNYGDTSLVGYWKFDEGTGTTAYDASGHGNNGTLTSGPVYTTAKVGDYALSFDGSDDWVNIASSTSLAITGSITVTAWIKAIATSTNYQAIVSKGYWMNGGYILTWHGTNRTPYFFLRKSDNSSYFYGGGGNTLINLNEWYFFVGIYDGNKAKIYVNNVYGNTSNSGVGIYNNNLNIAIGGVSNTSSYKFNGLIDDVRIYNRAFSAAEVAALYNAANR